MALSADEIYALATTPEAQHRISGCFLQVATEVIDEPFDTPGYSLRFAFARSVLISDIDFTAKWAGAVIANGIISNGDYGGANEITDIPIKNSIRDLWNTFSGYTLGNA